MRFQKTFQRQKGGTPASVPAIGSDAAPTTTPPQDATTNLLSCRLRDINGWPVQRIVVGWNSANAVTPTPFNADLYFWEDASQCWYKINDTPLSLKPAQLYVFDTFAVSEPPPTQAFSNQPGSPSQAGSMDVMLVVSDPGAQVNGLYTFVMSPDVTTVGT